MKILIGPSYFRIYDPKEFKKNMPYPPLGTLYFATLLKEKRFDFTLFDSVLAKSEIEFKKLIRELNPDILILFDDEFNFLTKMCLSNMRFLALDFIREAKKYNIPSIIYNSDAIDNPEVYLNSGCSIVVEDNPENTITEILDTINFKSYEKDQLKLIKGIKFYNSEHEIIFTGKRSLVSDLDYFPEPDFNLINIEDYKSIWIRNHGYFSFNISTTRGCPYSCNWCSKPLHGRTYAMHSPDRVSNQIKNLVEKYSVNHIWITDDIFGLKYSWLKLFVENMVSKDIHLTHGFKCLSRADLIIKNDTARLLSQVNCDIVWIGAESGSQKILDAMEKGITTDQIIEASISLRKNNVKFAFFIQFGYLGETWEDIIQTRQLIKKCKPDDIGISVSYPLPGTSFYKKVEDSLAEKRNWTDSDDLDLMFPGTYSPQFYKILYKFVHLEYNLQKIVNQKLNVKKFLLVPLLFVKMKYYEFKLRSHRSASINDLSLKTIPA